MKLVKIRFIRDALFRVRGYSHPDNPVFKSGTVHELRQDSAQRWLKRGVAEQVNEEVEKAAKDDKVSAKPEPAASALDSDDSGDKPAANKPKPRKGVAGDF